MAATAKQIQTPRQYRDTPILDSTTPAGWEPEGTDHRDQSFKPEVRFQELREEHENLRFALFSGGYDSLVAVHWAMEQGDADAVLHANTLTAIPENTEFVKEVCQAYGWPLHIVEAPKTLKEFCLTTGPDGDPFGYPGGGAHSIAFRWFKERGFRQAAKENPARKPDLITGVRQSESERRMRTVSAEVQETDRFIWKAPLWKKSEQWMDDYREEHGLPLSITVELLDRSGDCFCGAFADRISELERLKDPVGEIPEAVIQHVKDTFGQDRFEQFLAALRDFHGWLMAVEEQVQDVIGTDRGYCYWGHPEESSHTLRTLKSERDQCQVMLCESCGEGKPRWKQIIEETEAEDSDSGTQK